jgi:putative flippase GtrA
VTWKGENGQWRHFFMFIVTGGIAALVNIGTRIVFNLLVSFEIAVVLAYLCGMTTAYLLARYFVFERSGRTVHDEYFRFALVNLAAIIQVWIVSVGLADRVFPYLGFSWHADIIAHVIGVAVPVFTSFLGHRNFSFAQKASP